MAKAPDAFRTISEVADWLDTPAHVLRFWESKFPQIKPIKRAGGRRYYRPEDMELLGGIKALLHDQGLTIKGAQKLLRDQGVKHVASLGLGVDALTPNETGPNSPETAGNVDASPQTEIAAPNASAEKPTQMFADILAQVDRDIASPPLSPPKPRLLATLRGADRAQLRANSSRLRPYLRQLQDLRARMGRD